MKLLVSGDAHIFRTPDGQYWCKSIYGYDFWKRYLDVFDTVRIAARVKDVPEMTGRKLLVSGEGIEVYPLPFYQGPVQLLKVYAKMQLALRHVADGCDAAILRLPGQTPYMVYSKLPKGMPFAGEIVYDMTDDLAHPDPNPILKWLDIITSNRLKQFCLDANGVSYVTEQSIQRNYPAYAKLHGEDSTHFETFYSSIALTEAAFLGPRDYTGTRQLRLALTSAAMNSERKGERIVIQIVQKARQRGYDVSAVIIGDGSLRPSFEEYAKELGIAEHITFTGMLATSDQVREAMKNSDIFVYPTQGEGLPRGILEAMAAGMPVLSTPKGGIPEVLSGEYLFDPFDVDGFTNKICELLDHPEELTTMSRTNYKKSLEYANCILQQRRNEFYTKLKNLCK